MVQTRAQTRKLKSKRASYRRRVKSSRCRGLTRTCRVARGCKKTKSGKRGTYCRKTRNHKVRSLKGGRKRRSTRTRKAGTVIGDAAVPLALLALNTHYRPGKGKRLLSRGKKFLRLKGGKKGRKSRKGSKKSKKGRKSLKSRKSRRSRKH